MEGIQIRTTKDGEKRYRAQVRVKKGYVSKTFKSLTKAKLWRQKIICSIEDKSYFKTAEAAKHTLAEAITRYELDVLPNKPRAKQEQQLRWWREQLGSYILSDISPSLIAEYRDKLSQTITKFGRKMAPTTVLRYLAAISSVYTWLQMEKGWVEESPVKKVSKPKVGLLRARFLSDEERDRLLKVCKEESSNPYLYPIVVLALATGMRKSEILTLKPSSIDVINGRILLEQTKNNDRRVVPLKGHALAVIKELLQQKKQNINYLFPSKNGMEPIDIRFPWEQALKRASISNFRLHDLRHSASEALIRTGASLVELGLLLGHRSFQTVTRRYSHISDNHAADVVTKMNEKIFG